MQVMQTSCSRLCSSDCQTAVSKITLAAAFEIEASWLSAASPANFVILSKCAEGQFRQAGSACSCREKTVSNGADSKARWSTVIEDLRSERILLASRSTRLIDPAIRSLCPGNSSKPAKHCKAPPCAQPCLLPSFTFVFVGINIQVGTSAKRSCIWSDGYKTVLNLSNSLMALQAGRHTRYIFQQPM